MTKRIMIRIVSYSLAAAVIATGFAVAGWNRSHQYKGYLENGYQRAFSELVTSINSIDYALQKCQYSTSPAMLVSLGSEVFRQSGAANAALAQLPFSDLRLEKTAKFISQAGDYSFALAKRAAAHEPITSQDRETIASIASTADALGYDLNNLSREINENSLQFGDVARAEEELSRQEQDNGDPNIASNVAYLEQEFPEYPTLVYDGPFSEHISSKSPSHLEGKATVSEDAARRVAARFLGLDASALTADKSVSGGKLPAYTFRAQRDGGEVSIDVTQTGGAVLSMIDSRTPGTARLTVQEATSRAKQFLAQQGYPALKESYWTQYSNTVMINFAPIQDGATIYPDLVKVTVALDTGSICNFEAVGYLMNHKDRSFPEPQVTAQQAKEHLAPGLTLLSQDMAVVPTAGEREVYTHELTCQTQDGRHCLIYVDAQTGQEVQILILLEDENGILAM